MNELALFSLVALLAALAVGADAADERPEMRAWADAALLGKAAPKTPPGPGLEVRRQDYGVFSLRKSVMDTPLQIGAKHYQRGLGTHAISEVIVRLPRAGARFTAEAGVENNYDTAGQRGTAVFSVEVAGKEAYKSGVHKGGMAPLAVDVPLNGAAEFVLRVGDAGDGPGWDQSDWADAAVTLDNGERLWLDDLPVYQAGVGLETALPFSFVYGGKPSAELLPTWKRADQPLPAEPGKERYRLTFTDPVTGLEVACDLICFTEFPAVEWVLHFRNTGAADTPVLSDARALDLRVNTALAGKNDPVLRHSYGSTCAPTDFLPLDEPLKPNADLKLAPAGGRSSNGALPFFNLEWGGGGLVGAIGWSGQWQLTARRNGGRTVLLQAGQQTTHLKLHPGESIRTPRILLVRWQGDDRMRGHNLLRRLILAHHTPRAGGEPILPPMTQNTWFTFNAGNDVTEANQLEAMEPMAPIGVEGYWLDAGWFEGGWPAGAGSWTPKKEAFPRGLRPLGDAAHAAGMKFVVWFEPERVNAASRIAKEHPQFVLHAGNGDGLFNLGDPEARRWLAGYLGGCIRDWGIDIYRNDFNIDPLPFWQAADAPDRQGMAEIRYVEGLYALWDELLAEHPGLAIDNCASGGRRIDLETISRSYPLWRSDTQCCGHAVPVQDQVQTAGLSLYVPLHAAGAWAFDPYTFRSVATTGTSLCMDTRKGLDAALAKQAIAEAKALRPFYTGDYYPLLPITTDESHWCGWQLDRPDLGEGIALFFRRPGSPYPAVDAGLRALDAGARYQVSFSETYAEKEKQTLTGAELAHLRVQLTAAPSSVLVKYKKVR